MKSGFKYWKTFTERNGLIFDEVGKNPVIEFKSNTEKS